VQAQLILESIHPRDQVFTPDWCAADMVAWFNPTGRILEPAKGEGAILNYLPGADWCEIEEGRDFFAWSEQVDWIISNPPYSCFREWLEHSFSVSINSVYLIPLKNFFSAFGQLSDCRKHGWVKHIRLYGTGAKLGFPMGNAVGAIHFMRGYWGDTSWSFYTDASTYTQDSLLNA
jgi:hypothetical protein